VFELKLSAEDDGDGVLGGRDAAEMLIDNATSLLVPYAGECPGCTEDLFCAIAEKVLAHHHAQPRTIDGGLGTGRFIALDKDAFDLHIKATQTRTDALLATTHNRHKY